MVPLNNLILALNLYSRLGNSFRIKNGFGLCVYSPRCRKIL